MILIESINLNPNLSVKEKLDLVRKTMDDCREKQIGKLLIETIEKKTKKERKKSQHSEAFMKKQQSSNIRDLVKSVKADNEGRY